MKCRNGGLIVDLKPKKILVIDLAFIGDVILATPVMRALKEAWPEASIVMLTVPLTKDVAAMDPFVDEVMVYDKRGEHKGLPGMLRMAGRLRKRQFDLAVCMNFAVRGAAVAWLAGIPQRLGYDAQHAGLFLNHTASAQREGIKHETLNHLEVLKPLELFTRNTSLSFRFPAEAEASLAQKKQELGIPERGYLVLCPFGSYERKNLPEHKAVGLIRRLMEESSTAGILEEAGVPAADAWLDIYLIGGPREETGLRKIADAAGLERSHVLAGSLSLPELAVFLRDAACLVTVDTGPQHIAQAAGCPTIALFGPTDPVIWGPRGERDIVLYDKPDCSPCWGKGECPQPGGCIAKLENEEIIKAVNWIRGKGTNQHV